MPKSNIHQYDHEFPLLPNLGLYAAAILGDGNCLFNALSDQLYGSQDRHFDIRTRVIDYLRQNRHDMKWFLDVGPGGSTRRQPRRKNAGGYSNYHHAAEITEADVDRSYDQHLERMSKGGTWGDNMEIVAFAKAFNVNVKVYRAEFAYIISGASDEADICHIAYHDWEHYSSIRNVNGPHTGIPEVKPAILSPEEEKHIAARQRNRDIALNESVIKELDAATGGIESRDALIHALQKAKGDVYVAWDILQESDQPSQASQQDTSSYTSAPSSSFGRTHDSSSDGSGGQSSKRQDRRLSKATKTKQRHDQIAAHLGSFPDDSLESLQSSMINLSSPQRSQDTIVRHVEYDPHGSETDSEDWKPPALKDGYTSSSSEYSAQSNTSKITLKLNANSIRASHGPSPKRLGAARDQKSLKKQAQKQAAREKKRANKHAKLAIRASDSQPPSQPPSHPAMSSGITTLSI